MLIAIVTSFLLSIILTFLLGDKKEVKSEVKKEHTTAEEIYAPLNGKTVILDQVKDEMFASEAMGRTFAIEPLDGDIYAPCSGTVSALFPTGHAIGITTENGVELLIHIGINTVELNGKYFETLTEQGKKIQKGQKLIHFDADRIRSEGYEATTMLIVTNFDELKLNECERREITDNKTLLFTAEKNG